MNTEIRLTTDSQAIERAKEVLKRGGIIAFPTDTVYGLAAMVTDAGAIEKLFAAKGRDFNKAIAVLVGDEEQVGQIAVNLNDRVKKIMRQYWPGAITLVVEKNPGLPVVLSPSNTVGVRMPRHDFALALLRAVGPLATTSANISGQRNPITAQDVLEQLNGRVELILDGGTCPGGVPSTVLDCTGAKLVILRLGAITDLNFSDEET